MLPAPTRAKRTGVIGGECPLAKGSGSTQTRSRLAQGGGDVIYMFVGVALAPREHQDAFQRLERAGETLAAIVQRLRARQRERPAAVPQRLLFLEDLASKRGLLDVARRRRDTALLQRFRQPDRPIMNDLGIDAHAILPVNMLAAWIDIWRRNPGDVADLVG